MRCYLNKKVLNHFNLLIVILVVYFLNFSPTLSIYREVIFWKSSCLTETPTCWLRRRFMHQRKWKLEISTKPETFFGMIRIIMSSRNLLLLNQILLGYQWFSRHSIIIFQWRWQSRILVIGLKAIDRWQSHGSQIWETDGGSSN